MVFHKTPSLTSPRGFLLKWLASNRTNWTEANPSIPGRLREIVLAIENACFAAVKFRPMSHLISATADTYKVDFFLQRMGRKIFDDAQAMDARIHFQELVEARAKTASFQVENTNQGIRLTIVLKPEDR